MRKTREQLEQEIEELKQENERLNYELGVLRLQQAPFFPGFPSAPSPTPPAVNPPIPYIPQQPYWQIDNVPGWTKTTCTNIATIPQYSGNLCSGALGGSGRLI